MQNAVQVSAKNGVGIESLLEEIVTFIPAPRIVAMLNARPDYRLVV